MNEIDTTPDFKNELDIFLAMELMSKAPCEQRVRELVSQGANVNAIDGVGESMIMTAIDFIPEPLDLKFIKLSIELGADVNYQTPKENSSVLHSAIFSYCPELFEVLLENGANPNVIGDDGETILDSAEFDFRFEGGYLGADKWNAKCCEPLQEIITLLKKYGAKTHNELSE